MSRRLHRLFGCLNPLLPVVSRLSRRNCGDRLPSTLTPPPAARREHGQSLVLFALGLVAFAGLVGLSIDVGNMVWARTDQQKAADAAVLAAIHVYLETGDPAEAREAAIEYASGNGYEDAVVTVNNPPVEGELAGNPDAFEVSISRPLSKYFIGVVYGGDWSVSARAAARVYEEQRGFGVVTLHPTACDSLVVNGSLKVQNGGAIVNSNCQPNAMYVGTGGVVDTEFTHVHGTYQAGSGATLEPDPVIYQPRVPDPYGNIPEPSLTNATPPPPVHDGGDDPPECTGGPNQRANYGQGSWTFQPGRYRCELSFSARAEVTFKAGDYVFEGGLDLSRDVTVTMERGIYATMGGLDMSRDTTLRDPSSGPRGVLIYNTCYGGCGTAGTIDIHSSASINLTYYGNPYGNILIYQDRSASETIQFNADSFTSPGAIYAASAHLEFSSSTDVPLQFVASTVRINSSAEIDVDVSGGQTVMVKFAELVE